MKNAPEKRFEQVLTSTVRMIRTSWKVPVCLFLQMNEKGVLLLRAADGLRSAVPDKFMFKPQNDLVAQCLKKNIVLETGTIPLEKKLEALLKPTRTSKAKKFVVVPVAGQSRALGILIMGPVTDEMNLKSREVELRGAGNLCAVLSAYWRLYEWMNHFLPKINHQLRTPLTAIQGSLGMVLGGVFGDVGSEVKEMLQMAHKGCERTVTAIEEYINDQNPDDKI